MYDLLLINPGERLAGYQDLASEVTAVEPPLWCRLIAGYARDRGWRVRILDCDAKGLSADRTVQYVQADGGYRLICIVAQGHQPSASTQTMPAVRTLCKALKTAMEDTPILLVGGHVAALPERTLIEEPCDYTCSGEGPETVNQLLHALAADKFDVAAVPGLVWRGGWRGPVVNAAAPLLAAKELHGDAWDLLPMNRYRAHNWHCDDGRSRQPYASVYTSLGCPYACSFCCINASFGKPSYRMRDPAEVVTEILKLRDLYGVTNIKITDEMFVLNPRHVTAVCNLLAEANTNGALNIWAYARVDTAHRHANLLPLMRRAGIRWLALGIESGDDAVRDGADKAINLDVVDVVGTIQNAGIKVIGNFIFGLPGDTKASMWRTLELARQTKCDFVNFYCAMAYPGSQLYKDAEPRHLPPTWAGYSQHGYECVPYRTATLSAADVLNFRDWAHQNYFAGDPVLGTMLKRKLLENAFA